MLYIHTDNPQTVTALPNNWRGVENWGRNATLTGPQVAAIHAAMP